MRVLGKRLRALRKTPAVGYKRLGYDVSLRQRGADNWGNPSWGANNWGYYGGVQIIGGATQDSDGGVETNGGKLLYFVVELLKYAHHIY